MLFSIFVGIFPHITFAFAWKITNLWVQPQGCDKVPSSEKTPL